MERLIVEVRNNKNLEFLLELLSKFDFIHKIEKEKPAKKSKKNNMPIEGCKSNADIMSLAGIWRDKPRTIEEIREKAWKRN
jgi:hypothetical protein